MKKVITMIAIAMVAFLSNNAVAQENTEVGANIVEAMGITEGASMHFGTMTIPSAALTIDLAVDGSVSTVSSAISLLAQAPVSKAASYDVTGVADATFTVTLPANGVVTITGNGDPMAVSDFVTSTTGTLDGSGDASFTVGATLNVADAQAAGAYLGTFDVSVSYN